LLFFIRQFIDVILKLEFRNDFRTIKPARQQLRILDLLVLISCAIIIYLWTTIIESSTKRIYFVLPIYGKPCHGDFLITLLLQFVKNTCC